MSRTTARARMDKETRADRCPAAIYRWHWKSRLPDRRGQVFRVIARGALNSCLIEFADGKRFVTSRNALRRASGNA